MTDDQYEIIRSLSTVNVLPGGFDKRFIKGLTTKAEYAPKDELSESQIEWMYRVLYTYRRQVPGMYERHKHVPECSKKERF